jgi:hypothetical protein
MNPLQRLNPFCSVRGLETQISDLEAETGRLSRALEQQRSASAELEATANKKVEEFSRELQKRVGFSVISAGPLSRDIFDRYQTSNSLSRNSETSMITTRLSGN